MDTVKPRNSRRKSFSKNSNTGKPAGSSQRRPNNSGQGRPSNGGQGRPSNGGQGRGKKKAESTIDIRLLTKKALPIKATEFKPTRTYDDMPLHHKLKSALVNKGFSLPTQIQDSTIEPLIEGHDLVGIANTGTGKTGAFLIPIIERHLRGERDLRSLVVVPTRELALQVEEEFKSLTVGMGLKSATFIGGTKVGRDLNILKRQNEIVIGTPGRLMDLAQRGALRLNEIQMLILDEFDRMLDMGFINDIQKIVRAMTIRKQTLLFSATIHDSQKKLVNDLLDKPIRVKASSGTTTSDNIDQEIIRVPEGTDKFDILLEMLKEEAFEKVLIFAETKRLVNKISKRLSIEEVKTEVIHGNKSQNYRVKALDKFKKGKVSVLVATDVAARGIDISDISHVINYELPMTFDNYIHRIGRTGRAGKLGKAYTFVN